MIRRASTLDHAVSATASGRPPNKQDETTGMKTMKIAYQGEPGANSDIACRDVYPELEPLPCATFEDALAAVADGAADFAMIPIENSIAGRVADIHHLLPTAGLYIIGE
jgi:prephenate dehydratase